MDWFRAHHGISQDAKLHRIAVRLKVMRVVVTGAWLAVLDQASQSEVRGSIEHIDGDMLAFFAGMPKALAEKVLEGFFDAGLLTRDGVVVAWSKRQFSSDDINSRVKRFRERKANSLKPNDPGPGGNVTVTPPDTDTDIIPPRTPSECSPPLLADAKKRPPRRAGSRLPDDWKPDADATAYARGKGFNTDQIQNEAERFRNYWHAKAGKDAAKLDWLATWRNWVMDGPKMRSGGEPMPKPRLVIDRTVDRLLMPGEAPIDWTQPRRVYQRPGT